MVLVDANILAYLVIEGILNRDAQRLYRMDPEWHTEAFAFIELSNVLASYHRLKALTLSVCLETMREAEDAIGANVHSVLTSESLVTAAEFGISAYNARYIALARKLNATLVTEDKKLRKSAPDWTCSLDEALNP
jgi:predicted nucleic acid-binding protein